MDGKRVVLAFPQTYVNDSGLSVAALVRRHSIEDLRRPSKAEKDALAVAVEVAADAVEAILEEGPEAAMNRFNTLPE